ncbi:hypothetical protein [Xenorhabdus anantnagensis]|uniref:Uncharacterized protein n=1 Tax=Xenorhabdus anantnagensis TaxID=3025875 RepID=A0ABT5LQF7_9GAMM|nr:hypothetical protein [Xenorhabdus anantnagensis]MDC9596657.1 hypothetical protein [Xenorhabdus anantnagensis]
MLFIDDAFITNLLRYASQLVDISGDSTPVGDEKQVRIVDNLARL